MWLNEAILQALDKAGWLRVQPAPDLPELSAQILAYIIQHPDRSTAELAGVFGVSRALMSTRLQRLAQRDLIEARYQDRMGHWSAI